MRIYITKKGQNKLKVDCDIIEASLNVIHKYLLENEDMSDENAKALEAYNAAKYSLKKVREAVRQ